MSFSSEDQKNKLDMLILVIFLNVFCLTSSFNVSHDELEKCIKSHRIVGGICTSIVDRPFEVLLYIGTEPKCGGSIISQHWILTAAHCVRDLPEQHFTISVGSARIGGQNAQYYKIKEIIVHEDFVANASSKANDIALLRTLRSIKYNERVKPVKLSCVTPEAGDVTIVSGFGVTDVQSYHGNSEYLMSVHGKVIAIDACQSMLRVFRPMYVISNGTFCAGNLNGGQDSCRGDSGGPITIGRVLAGIVSWGVNCAMKMMPAFYTDVSYYVDWILKNTSHRDGKKKSKIRCQKSFTSH